METSVYTKCLHGMYDESVCAVCKRLPLSTVTTPLDEIEDDGETNLHERLTADLTAMQRGYVEDRMGGQPSRWVKDLEPEERAALDIPMLHEIVLALEREGEDE